MKLNRAASAGALAREDAKVLLSPSNEGIRILVDSPVKPLFGAHIEAAARDLLAAFGIENCTMEIHDQSALDYVIRSRVEAAICRAVEVEV